MSLEPITLTGTHIRLEPLGRQHAEGLLAAATADPSLYQWTQIPETPAAVTTYIDTALAWRNAGTGLAFATVSATDGKILGSTRFFNFDKWHWSEASPHYGQHIFDGCEIGYTWLTAPALRTPVNTEAKLLMMTHAFEVWNVLRVSFCTDKRNERSAAALKRIGATLDGVLRSHRMGADFTPRDSFCFSILAGEWPDVKRRLTDRLAQS